MDLLTLTKIDFIKTKFENELKSKMKLTKVLNVSPISGQ